MSLSKYKARRRFSKTPEPKGTEPERSGRRFVIQQHAARRLHFDLRLELGGTLKSWAVPNGLSLDPAQRRLAVHVEDHPLEYADFEGIIPIGEYGAGAMIVWDAGEWEPLGDADKDYAGGEIKFRLHGKKLTGAWVLVRMRKNEQETADNWLVIKERDETAVPLTQYDVIIERPESVLSGRTLAEVAAEESRDGRRPSRRRGPSLLAPSLLTRVKQIARTRPAPIFPSLEPALARATPRPPKDDQWLHEIKFDGYRILAWLNYGKVQLRTRHGHDWTARFPEIAAAVGKLPANTAILDGEIVALLPSGASSFPGLQQALSGRRTSTLVYCIFDVVYLEGYDLREAELDSRKDLLRDLLARNKNTRLQFVEHVVGDGGEFLEHCRELSLEGVVSKRRQGAYRSSRTDEWLKVKCVQAEPFVVGGYTSLKGQKKMRALMLGYHDERGRLIYAGKVGSGFSEESFQAIESRLAAIGRPACPFAEAPPKESGRDTHWVLPQLIAQVRYAGWSGDGVLWHPTFEGLRDDSDPADITRESVNTPGQGDGRRASATPVSATPVSAGSARGRGDGGREPVSTDLAGVKLTSPGKVLYPDAGITKLDLVKYYIEIAEWILPHVVDRPLTLVRCPDGLNGQSFFQKHAGRETPPTVRRFPVPDEADGKTDLLYVSDLKGLVSLVQVGVLEIHVWGSRVDRIERPDRMILDLDPDEAVPWSTVTQAAVRIRERLDRVGLKSYVKTTGGKGLHVVVPLERRQSWEEMKRFSQRLAQGLATDYPQSYTINSSKRARPGKIYLDFNRNTRGANAVAPYSTRARPGAPVATPVAWEELTPDLRPDRYNVRNLAERLLNLSADPWAGLDKVRQTLTPAILRKI